MRRKFKDATEDRPGVRNAHLSERCRCGRHLRAAGTTRNQAALLLLLVACLSWAGCAGFDRSATDRAKIPSGLQAVYDQERVELERELTLYSD